MSAKRDPEVESKMPPVHCWDCGRWISQGSVHLCWNCYCARFVAVRRRLKVPRGRLPSHDPRVRSRLFASYDKYEIDKWTKTWWAYIYHDYMNSYDGDECLRPAEFADFIAETFPEFFEQDDEHLR